MEAATIKIGTNFNRRNSPMNPPDGAPPSAVKVRKTVNIVLQNDHESLLYAENIPEGLLRRFTQTGRDHIPPSGSSFKSQDLGSAASSPNSTPTITIKVDFTMLPTRRSWERIRFWMDKNRSRQMPMKVIPLMPPNPDEVGIEVLVDTLAATIAIGLLPRAKELRRHLLARITATPLMAEDMQYIWESMPRDDGVIMRMVRSYYAHDKSEAFDYHQKSAIYDYTASEPELDQKFLDVETEREQRMKNAAIDQERDKKAYEQRQRHRETMSAYQAQWTNNTEHRAKL